MRRLILAVLGLVPLLAAGAARAQCPEGTEAATIAEAYFGRNIAGAHGVSDEDWTAFLAEVVTPAFPDGLTAIDGYGQWRNRDGRIAREQSKLLVLVLPGEDAAAARRRLLPVAEAYKARFRQQSVLTVFSSACVAF